MVARAPQQRPGYLIHLSQAWYFETGGGVVELFFYFGKQLRGADRTERGKGRGLIAETGERPGWEAAGRAASGGLIGKTIAHSGRRPLRRSPRHSVTQETQECSPFSISK